MRIKAIDQERPLNQHIGNQLKTARNIVGWSQNELAERVGLSFQGIQKHEAGIVRIGAGRLWKYAQALGVPVEYFFAGLDEKENGECGDHPTKDPRIAGESSTARRLCMQLVAESDEEDVKCLAALLTRLTRAK